MISLGLIVEEKKGKITLVSANKNLPYFPELKNMMVKTAGLGDQIRNALSKLKGIRYALIYGSFASGEETESSDIDLLLVGKLNEEELLKAVSKVEKEVGREINYILWSDEEFSNKAKNKHHLLSDIVRKQVIMLVGDGDEFRRAVKK
ncbi:MAG: nucleotidyltransferase domain-containing protein [Nitrososphaerales archaeon]|nr:nucleotidyltransferase domain-containing protein [Nitrososphaerales archaeon]